MKSSIVTLLLALALVSSPLAADTKDDIVAVEKSTFKAWANKDMKAYGDTMADDAILIAASGNVYLGKQAILADLTSTSDPCDVKSFDLADTKVRQLSTDIAVLTYNLTQDVTCKATGKLAAKAFVTSIYVRQGGKWRWVSYQETPLKK